MCVSAQDGDTRAPSGNRFYNSEAAHGIQLLESTYKNKMASHQTGERKMKVIQGQSFQCGPRYTNLAYIGEGKTFRPAYV